MRTLPPHFHCGSCGRATTQLAKVEHSRGLVAYGPELRCDGCLAVLRAEERLSPLSLTDKVWDVRVIARVSDEEALAA